MRAPFIKSVIVILLVTSMAKLISATGTAPVLALPDPLLGISNRQLLLVAGMLELLAIVIIIRARRERIQLLTIAWLSSAMGLYRLAMFALDAAPHCNCLGTMTQKLHIPAQFAERFMFGVFLYLLFGSILFLAGEMFQGLRKPKSPLAENN